jgi:hypothetical protein
MVSFQPCSETPVGRAHFAQRAGVVVSDVQAAERFDGGGDQLRVERFGSDVAGQRDGGTAVGFNFRDQRVEFGLAARGDDNLGAFGGEQFGGGAADAGGCAGDDGDFVLQAVHFETPCGGLM